ncbi:MAG TPA: hypothetical protein VEB42_01965, partial [Chitinophagaceae bacterium]|nr:hypothetical protein [Chitinophagaceae bacterium]
ANSLIRQESGGGIKVIGNKFNNSKLADGGPWHQDFCYSATFQTGHTVLAIFTSNSFENYKVSAIKIVPNGNFGGMVVVTGNQLSSYNNGTTDIDFSASGFPSAVISGNVGAGGTGKTFVNYAGVTGGLTIASNSTTDYTTLPPIFLQTNHNNVTRFHIDGEGNILVPMISGGGTVDATIIDGSTNAVAGNAVYDALQGKQAAINLTTTGTSGAATFDGTNLNIPQYSGAGGGSGDILSTLLSSEVSITGATALTSSAFGKMHVCTGTTADYTVGLPAAAGNAGKFIGFRMASALTVMVTLDGNSAETIDAAVERIMWKNEVAILYCDGTTWTKIAGKSIPMVCVVAPSANSASLGEGNRTIISLNATITDAAGMADNGNNRVIIKRPGNYLVTPIARFEALSANTARLIAFASKNGSSDDFLHQGEGSGLSGSIPFIGVGSIATYAAGDNLRMGVFFGGGAASAIVRGNSTTENSTLSIEEKVSW